MAVEGFDLRVEKGEFISFVGPSGCGKTTTLRMIAGLEEITEGELLIRGRNFTHVPAETRPTATIFQNYAIFPHMSVRENIAFGLQVREVATDDDPRAGSTASSRSSNSAMWRTRRSERFREGRSSVWRWPAAW